MLVAAPQLAHGGEIPIITLSDVGPDQEVPTSRSFYVAGDAAPTVENAQAIVVRRGTPGLLGDDGPDCHNLLADLRLDLVTFRGSDDDEEDDSPTVPVRYDAGMHLAFEVFPRAEGVNHDAAVLVSAPWRRSDDESRQFKVLVPHDPDFFAGGYGYCMFVVQTERAQQIDDVTLGELVDGVARKLVACGDKSSCDEDVLAEYQMRLAKELSGSHAIAAGPAGKSRAIAAQLKEAARAELASATALVEARDHLEDRWHDKIGVMTPASPVVWADTATDPFAQALATMLARAAALLPQVRGQKAQTSVALYTTDGKLQVKAVQLLDDGRSIRVASSRAPSGDQARVLTATTDMLDVADGITVYDLIALGHGRVRVDRDWVTLAQLGERVGSIGLPAWTADDGAYLASATAQLKRLSDFVDAATTGVVCKSRAFEATEAEQSQDAIHHHLGEWLVCQHVDAAALAALANQLKELAAADQTWHDARDKLVAKSKRIVTITTTAPIATKVAFTSNTWVFSYVTPIVGYAGVLRPDESFGLFYLGVQLHLDPNPVDDAQWRDGVTTKDLRRALAIELGLAPYTGTFGPERRYGGPGGLPPLFVGLAVHVIPYTSVTFGGAFIDRKNTTLPEEQPHTIFAPYLGFTLQLNLPDLIRRTAFASSDTTAFR